MTMRDAQAELGAQAGHGAGRSGRDWGGPRSAEPPLCAHRILSVGESQKLAFARLFVKKPEFAFLDESTSAVSVEEEASLYANLQSICKTYVSVGHRMSLLKFHTHVLQLEKGKWQLHKAEEFVDHLD